MAVTVSPENKARPDRHLEPRILIQKPSPSFCHPATRTDIRDLLRAIGPIALYGLRTVELICGPSDGSLVFGRYEAPGRILLFHQPVAPWRLSGTLKRLEARRLKRAGAIVRPQPGAGATSVDWPADTLRQFMLEDVLLHELGHHVLQQHKGKRPVRIARTKDHEAFAARFAARQRLRLNGRETHLR